MVVVIIIGVLSSISVPIYRQYISRARASEGVALVGAVASAQRIYHMEHRTYSSNPAQLDVNVAQNTYFKAYALSDVTATGFTVTTNGTGEAAGITVTLVQNAAGGPVITTTGI